MNLNSKPYRSFSRFSLYVLLGSILFMDSGCNREKAIHVSFYSEKGIARKSLTSNTDVPIETGVIQLGSGYNTAIQEIRATGSVESPDTTMAQEKETFHLDYINTLSQLREAMSVGGGASFGIGVFSIGGKAKFQSELEVNTSSDYLLVSDFVTTTAKQLKNPMLSAPARSKLDSGINPFLDYAGDEFVNEAIYGGELYILFIANAHSQTERKSNSESFNVAIKAFQLGGDRSAGVTSLNSIKTLKVAIYRRGDDGFPISDSTKVGDLINYAGHFHERVKASPAQLMVRTKQYSTLSEFPYTIDYRNILIQKHYFEDIAIKAWQIMDVTAETNYVMHNPTVFLNHMSDSARLVNDTLTGRLINLKRCAEDCRFQFSTDHCNISNCPEMARPVPNFRGVLIDTATP